MCILNQCIRCRSLPHLSDDPPLLGRRWGTSYERSCYVSQSDHYSCLVVRLVGCGARTYRGCSFRRRRWLSWRWRRFRRRRLPWRRRWLSRRWRRLRRRGLPWRCRRLPRRRRRISRGRRWIPRGVWRISRSGLRWLPPCLRRYFQPAFSCGFPPRLRRCFHPAFGGGFSLRSRRRVSPRRSLQPQILCRSLSPPTIFPHALLC
jgi:hypothetical protein